MDRADQHDAEVAPAADAEVADRHDAETAAADHGEVLSTGAAGRAAATDGPAAATDRPSVVDWARTARRMRAMLTVIAVVVAVAWVVLGVVREGPDWALLAELAGFGLLGAFLAEVVVVGGSAVRGVLRAGERGDRLAGQDVSLLPPQLRRRRR